MGRWLWYRVRVRVEYKALGYSSLFTCPFFPGRPVEGLSICDSQGVLMPAFLMHIGLSTRIVMMSPVKLYSKRVLASVLPESL